MSLEEDKKKISDVLNKDLALENMGGDEELFKEVLVIYQEEASRKMSDLHTAIEESDSEGIRFAAHSLKGASANIGAVTVREIASEIEMAGSDKRISVVTELVDRLHEELCRLDSAIADEIGIE
ncbi:MAG: Hpt domain-containing protein [bacterium]|nr:Hpt domain-containing protein [bacterium]